MRSILLFALVVVVVSSISVGAETNLLVNPSFEELDVAGWATAWKTFTNAGQPTYIIDQIVSHNGTNSLRIVTTCQDRGNVYQDVTLAGGKTCRFTVWLRNDPGVTQQAIIRFRCWVDGDSRQAVNWSHDAAPDRVTVPLGQRALFQDTYISTDLLHLRGNWSYQDTDWKLVLPMASSLQ